MSLYEKVNIDVDKFVRIPIKLGSHPKLDSTSNLAASLSYLNKLYEQKLKKLNENIIRNTINDKNCVIASHKDTLTALIETLYDLSSFSPTNSQSTNKTQILLQTHLLQLNSYNYNSNEFNLEYRLKNVNILSTSASNEENKVLNDSVNLYNLYDILLYSPCAITDLNYEKILFIFYQLLKILRLLHNLNINCGNLKLNNLYINQNYWLKIRLPFSDLLKQYEINSDSNFFIHDDRTLNESKFLIKSNIILKQDLVNVYECYKHIKYDELINITSDWCQNKIDNFSYLLILNCLAGRKLNCAWNHPIFPWVCDFKDNKRGNLRDLTKTKYRLNKTDTHLDFIYQESSNNISNNGGVGYHLVEFLAEITYFVYKSRITDKNTLCLNVRSNWVPNEYPSSMARLYAWTPEECIPEFYCDATLFTSIHDDMLDLALPDWCNNSKEDFIRMHRSLLESNVVSQNIHNWIDLVFGYKLSGDAAIVAKNVCLPLVDNHDTMREYGVVQLFTVPHPAKVQKYEKMFSIFTSKAKDESIKHERKRNTRSDTFINQTVNNFINPLTMLEQVETLLKFTQKSYLSIPGNKEKKFINYKSFEELKAQDLKCITCILAEILLFQKLKTLSIDSSLEERLKIINDIISKEPHLIPSTFRSIIINTLKEFDKNCSSSSLTVDLLLNQHLALIPFKYYFNNLYNLSELLNRIDFIIENYNDIKSININELNLTNVNNELVENIELEFTNDLSVKQLIIETLYEQKFFIALNSIPFMLSDMNNIKLNNLQQLNKILNTNSTSNSFELILTYVQNLLENPYTCINSIVYLFNKVAKFLSKNELEKKFLGIIMHLLNVIDLEQTIGLNLDNSKMNKIELKLNLCKLFEYKFINSLRILFGLDKFLTQIIPLIVEAISGLKDIHVTNDVKEVVKQKSENKKNSKNDNQAAQISSEIFQMDTSSILLSTSNSSTNKLTDEINEDSFKPSPPVPVIKIDQNSPTAKTDKFSQDIIFNLEESFGRNDSISNNGSVNDNFMNEVSPNEDSYNANDLNINISIVARNTFNKIISQLGPVLTCKYFCTNLLKMLALCYMNENCLRNIENHENLLNSSKAIEGDKFSFQVLEALKEVSVLFGEHLIVTQYFAHVSNTVGACSQRLTYRLEASLLAGIVLVHYFVAYLDLKLLMDYLQYIFNQILLPAIKINGNIEIKFPNGCLIRNILSYKLLDILLLISLRLGRENTRVEMEVIFRTFFDSFSIHNNHQPSTPNSSFISSITSSIVNNNSPKVTAENQQTKPLLIEKKKKNEVENNPINSFKSLLSSDKHLEDNNEEVYYKLSYNQSNNEITGSSFKPDKLNPAVDTKFRSQSFTLLSFNNEDQEASKLIINNEIVNNKLANGFSNDELLNTFTIELAYIAYFSISRHISNNYVDSILSNCDLIHKLCHDYEKSKTKDQNQIKSKATRSNTSRKKTILSQPIKRSQTNQIIHSSSYGSSFNDNISVVGSQIQISSVVNNDEEEDKFNDSLYLNNSVSIKFNEHDLKETKSTVDSSRHLSDNWFAYWEHEIQNSQKKNNFDFKHINLMNFIGHTSTVKCIYALDNESSIITASKDKTVKLWTLKNHGGGRKSQQNCQWTYTHHKRPVFNVFFMDSLRLCVSCDGNIHAWDPFVGKKICQFDTPVVQCIGNLPSPSQYVMAATSDNFIKFIDLRSKCFAYEFRTINTSAGSIKCITANDNTLLAAYSNGLMCLLDIRTGWLQDSFRPHESEILQLKFYSCERFATSYTDGSIALSSNKDAVNSKVQLKNYLKVYNDAVSCLVVNENQIISGTTSNRIGIHSNIDKQNQTTFSLSRLQPDYFKSSLTSMAYLPMNRLLLLGADSGEMKLFC